MKTITAAIIIALALPSAAIAQERAGDAALGALSGALVLGPVGLVAGAVIGYTAGPAISRSWRRNRNLPRRHAQVVQRSRVAVKQRATASQTSQAAAGEVSPVRPAPGAGGPPAQGLE